MFDRKLLQPRLSADWAIGAPGGARRRRRRGPGARAAYGEDLTSVGLNLYRDGHDSVAWHGDRVGRTRTEVVVAVVSLGARRGFGLRPEGRRLGPLRPRRGRPAGDGRHLPAHLAARRAQGRPGRRPPQPELPGHLGLSRGGAPIGLAAGGPGYRGRTMTVREPDQADLVVVANRFPVRRVVQADGTSTWATSPGGLVGALAPMLPARHGVVGRLAGRRLAPATSAVRAATASRWSPVPARRGRDRRLLRRLLATARCGRCTTTPSARRASSRRGGRPTSTSTTATRRRPPRRPRPGATVWVHDYHLQLVPTMLRALRPDVRIGFFLHIPFPPAGAVRAASVAREMLEGLLGADLVGFQVPGRGAELRASSPAGSRRATAAAGACAATAATRAGRRVPDLDRRRRAREHRRADPRWSHAAARAPPAPRRPRASCCSASTGSTTRRASTPRIAGLRASCSSTAQLDPRDS